MKLKKIALVLFFLGLSFPFPVIAQTTDQNTDIAPVITDVEGLRAEFKQDTQNPATKSVKFTMVLHSTIDSDRVRITWTINCKCAFSDNNSSYQITNFTAVTNMTIQKGQTYNVPIDITFAPITDVDAQNEIIAKAEAFGVANNYVVTIRKDVFTDKDAEVIKAIKDGQPVLPDDYASAKNSYLIQTIVIIFVVVIAILIVGFLGIRLFIKWLDKDDVKDFEKNLTPSSVK